MFQFSNDAAAAKSLQSCPTLCDPIDGSTLGSPAPGILQARTLEWVAISFSNAWKWKVKVKSPSRVRFLATPWTTAYQAPPSMGFSRQEYWSGVSLPSPMLDIFIYVYGLFAFPPLWSGWSYLLSVLAFLILGDSNSPLAVCVVYIILQFMTHLFILFIVSLVKRKYFHLNMVEFINLFIYNLWFYILFI